MPRSAAFVAHIVLENEATITGGNNLVGSIAAVPWQNLPNLQIVNLQHNAIDGSPARLAGWHCRHFRSRRVGQQLRADDPDVPGAGPIFASSIWPRTSYGQHRRDRQRDGADAPGPGQQWSSLGNSLNTGLAALTNMLALQIVDLSDNEFTGLITN